LCVVWKILWSKEKLFSSWTKFVSRPNPRHKASPLWIPSLPLLLSGPRVPMWPIGQWPLLSARAPPVRGFLPTNPSRARRAPSAARFLSLPHPSSHPHGLSPLLQSPFTYACFLGPSCPLARPSCPPLYQRAHCHGCCTTVMHGNEPLDDKPCVAHHRWPQLSCDVHASLRCPLARA
jgi:hypothetical protein